MTTAIAEFEERWRAAWAGLGVPGPSSTPLKALYAEPHRLYHNLDHIAECFRQLRDFEQGTAAAVPPEVVLALCYHDAVYDPLASDNEARSSGFAAEQLAPFLAPPQLASIHRLIRITDHRTPPGQPDEQLIVDIDLSILGQPVDIFDAYERAIRREYAHVPDDAFRAGRARVLQHFLGRPALYHTPYFFRQYEARARVNLTTSLARLRTPHTDVAS